MDRESTHPTTARCRRSPGPEIPRLLVVMLISSTAVLPLTVVAADNNTLPESNLTTTIFETSYTTSGNETTSTMSSAAVNVAIRSQTTQPGIPDITVNNDTVSDTETSAQTTPSSWPHLSVTPRCLTLFVGMPAGTPLDVNISSPNNSLLMISVANGTDEFVLEKNQLVLNRTLRRELSYLVIIKTPNDGVQLLVPVKRLQFEQPIYLAAVPDNTRSQQSLMDINSNAERLGVPVLYSLESTQSMFSINSSTGVVCLERALDREVASMQLLNVSLHLAQSNVGHGPVSDNDTDQTRTFASFRAKVEAMDDKPLSFGNIGRELILSVPEHANESYVIATLKVQDSHEGLNVNIRYSLTNDSSGAFSINEGQLQVVAPHKLKDRHVFSVTVKAAYVNKTSSDVYLHIKIFVVDNIYDFILPTKLPAATLRQNCQYFTEELGTILGWRILPVEVREHEQIDASDLDRSELVFKAFELDTNSTIHVNASDIGIKLAEKSEMVSSMFGYIAQFLNGTSKDALSNSQYTMNSLSKILVAVACLLLLALIATAITACRRRRSCFRQKDDMSDEDPLSANNWYFSEDNHRRSNPLSEILENMDKSEFISVSQSMFTPIDQSRKQLMLEANFSFDLETQSLGLNTVARREHARDQQMEKLQLLFQALGNDILYTKADMYPKLDTVEHEGHSLPISNDTHGKSLLWLGTDASESAKPSSAVTESSNPNMSMLKSLDSDPSRIQPYPSTLADEDNELDAIVTQVHVSSQQTSTSRTDAAAISGDSLTLKPISYFSKRSPPSEESNTSHISSETDNSGDLISVHTSNQNKDLQLENPVKSDQDETSFVALHNADIDLSNEQTEGETRNSQLLFPFENQSLDSSSSEDVADQAVLVVISTEDVVTHF